MVFVAIPVKGLKDAKRRLEGLLGNDERRQLSIAMLKDVLDAVGMSKYVERIVIISCDRFILRLAEKMGAIGFDEGESRGLNSAIESVSKFCLSKGAESTLVLPIDIPLVKSMDIDHIIGKSRSPRSVVISPSTDERGTNALLMRPPLVIKPRFGLNSFKAHIGEAITDSIRYRIFRSPRVALDIDTPRDLALFSKLGGGTETYGYMTKIDLINRTDEYLKGLHNPLLRK
ncbi:MAG: 2-phospho-L-lactate guanylyltransferase [Nitrososphaerales archaeon]